MITLAAIFFGSVATITIAFGIGRAAYVQRQVNKRIRDRLAEAEPYGDVPYVRSVMWISDEPRA
jgi:hypothetical protein